MACLISCLNRVFFTLKRLRENICRWSFWNYIHSISKGSIFVSLKHELVEFKNCVKVRILACLEHISNVGHYRSIRILLHYWKRTKDTWDAILRTPSALRFRHLEYSHSSSGIKLLKDVNCVSVLSLSCLLCFDKVHINSTCVFMSIFFYSPRCRLVPQCGFWILLQKSLKHEVLGPFVFY